MLGRKTVEYMLSNHLGPDVENLIAAADLPMNEKLGVFGGVLGATALVILLVVVLSRPLTSLFDRISGEK